MITDYEGFLFLDSSSNDERSDNTAARFHSFMHTSFSFTSKNFEVGLHEIQVPYSWENLTTTEYVAAFDMDWCVGFHKVGPGCFYNVVDLIDVINHHFVGSNNPPRLVYDPEFKRLRSRTGAIGDKPNMQIRMTLKLARMLGFHRLWFEFGRNPPPRNVPMLRLSARTKYDVRTYGQETDEMYTVSDSPVNLQFSFPRLYVSSSIVKHRAHESRDILRVVPIRRDLTYCEVDVRTYERPIFVPLAHQAFDRIEIRITDSEGQEPIFTSGNVIVTLEIREKRDAFSIL